MTVTIPSRCEHGGSPLYLTTLKISDYCPVCGEKRGTTVKGFSYDGSRRLVVDCWENPCGHVDKYCDVRAEANKLKQTQPAGQSPTSTRSIPT